MNVIDTETHLFFYDKTSPFSNLFETAFSDRTYKYWCVEQYIMAQKAILLNKPNILKRILRAINIDELYRLRVYISDLSRDWETQKESVLRRGIQLKFEQNADIKKYLISTDKKILVFASPNDDEYGIAYENLYPPKTRNILFDPKYALAREREWGRNLLGMNLMIVRNKFIIEQNQELIVRQNRQLLEAFPIKHLIARNKSIMDRNLELIEKLQPRAQPFDYKRPLLVEDRALPLLVEHRAPPLDYKRPLIVEDRVAKQSLDDAFIQPKSVRFTVSEAAHVSPGKPIKIERVSTKL